MEAENLGWLGLCILVYLIVVWLRLCTVSHRLSNIEALLIEARSRPKPEVLEGDEWKLGQDTDDE